MVRQLLCLRPSKLQDLYGHWKSLSLNFHCWSTSTVTRTSIIAEPPCHITSTIKRSPLSNDLQCLSPSTVAGSLLSQDHYCCRTSPLSAAPICRSSPIRGHLHFLYFQCHSCYKNLHSHRTSSASVPPLSKDFYIVGPLLSYRMSTVARFPLSQHRNHYKNCNFGMTSSVPAPPVS